MAKAKVTVKQLDTSYPNGWAVFVDGRLVSNGLSRSEADTLKKWHKNKK